MGRICSPVLTYIACQSPGWTIWFFTARCLGLYLIYRVKGEIHAARTVVPMGWSGSVDLAQNVIRRFVFEANLISPHAELRVGNGFPMDQAALTCFNGFDVITKVPPLPEHSVYSKLFPIEAFVSLSKKLGLPLNVAKTVIESYNSMVLGGDLDGQAGVLRHERKKGHIFINTTSVLFSMCELGQALLQQWTGMFAFAAGFRRPLFCVLEHMFAFICSYAGPAGERKCLESGVVNEILCGALLLPLARSSLRAPLRRAISISDASEEGGSAAEAEVFSAKMDTAAGALLELERTAHNEKAGRLKDRPVGFFGAVCTAACSGSENVALGAMFVFVL